jgi:NAD(P)-dependent dehydrogenase (short-subunit alcohol dehydrogenase family)
MTAIRHILITGCSSGIGRACAVRLAQDGFVVFAGVRREADARALSDLGVAGLAPVILDVTDPSGIDVVVADIAARTGPAGLFALINNAGFNYSAPFEATEPAKARALMETNLFGAAFLAQACLPLLRRAAGFGAGGARIVNVGSIGSLVGIPWEPWYHASKFALIGLSESLFHEVRGQGIDVTVLCPGGIRTPFIAKSEAENARTLAGLNPEHRQHYGQGLARIGALVASVERAGSTPEHVAGVVAGLLKARRPPFRKFAGLDARIMATLQGVLPQGLFLRLIGAVFAPRWSVQSPKPGGWSTANRCPLVARPALRRGRGLGSRLLAHPAPSLAPGLRARQLELTEGARRP